VKERIGYQSSIIFHGLVKEMLSSDACGTKVETPKKLNAPCASCFKDQVIQMQIIGEATQRIKN